MITDNQTAERTTRWIITRLKLRLLIPPHTGALSTLSFPPNIEIFGGSRKRAEMPGDASAEGMQVRSDIYKTAAPPRPQDRAFF